jgi:hypothetical protein
VSPLSLLGASGSLDRRNRAVRDLPTNRAAQSDAFRPALNAPTRSAPSRER